MSAESFSAATQLAGRPGREVTGRAVRAVLGLAAAGLVLTAIVNLEDARFGPVPLVLAILAGAIAAGFPSSPAPLAVSAVAIVLFVADDSGFSLWLVLGASLLHTVHVLAGLADVIPARARAEYRALAPSMRRWVRTQGATVPVLVILAALL
jgi:hypothetical protein